MKTSSDFDATVALLSWFQSVMVRGKKEYLKASTSGCIGVKLCWLELPECWVVDLRDFYMIADDSVHHDEPVVFSSNLKWLPAQIQDNFRY